MISIQFGLVDSPDDCVVTALFEKLRVVYSNVCA